MTVIPEDTLLRLLRTCLELSQKALQLISTQSSTKTVPKELLEQYSSLIRDLHREKRHDLTLADECWDWIWEIKPDLNALQLYGRLAWINYSLVDLL